ncbi:MAG TPA: phosphotransferase [Tepidisphaeraceae bacterium]|nr:phosphotransferase [Tepidisphaeraceae bacterium]
MQPTTPESQSIATSSGASQTKQAGARERFAAEELAAVLSHWEIGIIESITEFPRGSRKAPKALIVSENGKFLLKRRARGRDDPYKVAFCHAIQLHLASQQFPLPHLLGTKRDNNSMLQWHGGVYELFEYIPGHPYSQSLEASFESGKVLGLFHKLLEHFRSEWQPPTGSYHMAPSVESGLRAIPNIVPAHVLSASGVEGLLSSLLDHYRRGAEVVETLGLELWPRQIVHADWHPGNMLFRDGHVAAVIDYDSARALQRVIDIANGCLQFSIIGGEQSVDHWPEYLDESRFKRFLRGYDDVMLLSQAEIRAIPWLMIEALIAEATFPIAATGSFGRLEGLAFLQMVNRKVKWLAKESARLAELAEG